MADRGQKGRPEWLSVVDTAEDPDMCGYPTVDGSPCERNATGRCWQHEDEPDHDYAPYPPPDHFGDLARRLWNRLVPPLAKYGILTEINRPILEGLCELYESRRRAYDEWREGEVTVEAAEDGDRKKNAAWTTYKQAAQAYRLHASEAGLTPTAIKKLARDDGGEDATVLDKLEA